MRTNRRDHISPVLASLYWVPVKFRMKFKILLLTYKALNDQAPSYLEQYHGYIFSKQSTSTAGLLAEPSLIKPLSVESGGRHPLYL